MLYLVSIVVPFVRRYVWSSCGGAVGFGCGSVGRFCSAPLCVLRGRLMFLPVVMLVPLCLAVTPARRACETVLFVMFLVGGVLCARVLRLICLNGLCDEYSRRGGCGTGWEHSSTSIGLPSSR